MPLGLGPFFHISVDWLNQCNMMIQSLVMHGGTAAVNAMSFVITYWCCCPDNAQIQCTSCAPTSILHQATAVNESIVTMHTNGHKRNGWILAGLWCSQSLAAGTDTRTNQALASCSTGIQRNDCQTQVHGGRRVALFEVRIL